MASAASMASLRPQDLLREHVKPACRSLQTLLLQQVTLPPHPPSMRTVHCTGAAVQALGPCWSRPQAVCKIPPAAMLQGAWQVELVKDQPFGLLQP